jgi:hypothetical protein
MGHESDFDRAWLAYLKLLHEDMERIAKVLESMKKDGIIAYPRA